MHLKQNNFYGQYNDAVECYIELEWYILNPLFIIMDTLIIYTQRKDYSHIYNKVEVGYVLSK